MPTFVDIFSGAGGLSLGLQNAGWRPLLALDSWSDAINTYKQNFGYDHAEVADVCAAATRRRLENLDTQPDWVVGGPPCQGFSTVGKRQKADPRNLLVREFARLVEILAPKGVLVENVLGLRDMRFVDFFVSLLREIGYEVQPLVLRAADYGVPQLRRRIVFVGMRSQEGRFFHKPRLAHNRRAVTVWDAIGDLPELAPGDWATEYDKAAFTTYQRRMRAGSTRLDGHVASKHPATLVRAISFIPDGGNRTHIPPRYQPKSGFHNSYSRLNSSGFAVAVTQNMGKPSGTRCIHPFQNRGLTAREGARLQGFPDRFVFAGKMMSQRLQIANAVPPLLAEFLGQALANPSNWRSEPAVAPLVCGAIGDAE
jgi:DNA (cytosine-5)-methyltransferase 1